MSTNLFLIKAETTETGTIFVDDDNTEGPWDGSEKHPFKTINDAIDIALNGDTIFVRSGEYSENGIIINKSISLIGENKESTILHVLNLSSTDMGLNIRCNSVNLREFTFYYDSIVLFGTPSDGHNPGFNNVTIKNNIFLGMLLCVFNHSHNNIISNNLFNNTNASLGLSLYLVDYGYNSNNYIRDNIISNNDYGMVIGATFVSEPIIVTGNNFINNTIDASFGLFRLINTNTKILDLIFKDKPLLKNTKKPYIGIGNWDENYWDNHKGFGPKIIPGIISFRKGIDTYSIPWIQLDRSPAKNPYEIKI